MDKVLKSLDKIPICACGCGKEVNKNVKNPKKWNKFIHGHASRLRKILPDDNPPLCKCGCGEYVKWDKYHRRWNTYLNHHMSFNHTEETKDKMSKTHTGKTLSEEHKENIGISTNKRYEDPKERMKHSRKGEANPFYGKTHSDEQKEKWCKERNGRILTEEHKINIGIGMMGKESPMKGKTFSEEWKKEKSDSMKLLWKTKEYQDKQKISLDIKPNKLELFFDDILNEYLPKQYEFVGDYSYFIGNKNPDFVNKKEKKVIEVFGDYWHRDDNPDKRAEYFSKYGYECLIIWENEFSNLDRVIKSISIF